MRYYRVALAANGRVKPDVVMVNGKEERHAEGAYYLEWRNGSKRVRLSVGKNAQDAHARRLHKEAELNAINNGVSVKTLDPSNKQRSIADAVAIYLAEIKLSRTPATHSAYTLALRNFTDSCSKSTLEQIDRVDLLQYVKHLRDGGLSDRTCHNRLNTCSPSSKQTALRSWQPNGIGLST
jgi:hypothetical protein